MDKAYELKEKYEKKAYVPVEKADLEYMLEMSYIAKQVETILALGDDDESKLAFINSLFYNE